MSNGTQGMTLALGAGGGLLLWYLLRDKHGKARSPTTTTSTSEQLATAPGLAPRACVLRLDTAGLFADGVRVGVPDAVNRCKAAGRADVTVIQGAPAAAYADLMIALGRADVPTFAHRNAGGRRRRAHRPRSSANHSTGFAGPVRNAETSQTFTLITYTQGFKAAPRLRWFRADAPVTWANARDRLGAARMLDLGLAGRSREPGGWMLSIDPHHFRAERAEPLPGESDG